MSKQLQTKLDFSRLSGPQLLAIELKYKGYSYNDIAGEIEKRYQLPTKESRIKMWFWVKGTLKPYYDSYAQEMGELNVEETTQLFKANLRVAAGALLKEMGKGGGPAVRAAELWLERALGKVVDKSETKNLNITATLADLMRQAEEAPDTPFDADIGGSQKELSGE